MIFSLRTVPFGQLLLTPSFRADLVSLNNMTGFMWLSSQSSSKSSRSEQWNVSVNKQDVLCFFEKNAALLSVAVNETLSWFTEITTK